jgi:transcriptional regulator with XRE-family HTH domain
MAEMLGLAAMRKAHNLTQEQLAEKMGGVAPITVSRWETGKQKPDIDTIEKIARTLKCTIPDLLNPPPAPAAGAKKQKPRPVMKDRHKRKAA